MYLDWWWKACFGKVLPKLKKCFGVDNYLLQKHFIKLHLCKLKRKWLHLTFLTDFMWPISKFSLRLYSNIFDSFGLLCKYFHYHDYWLSAIETSLILFNLVIIKCPLIRFLYIRAYAWSNPKTCITFFHLRLLYLFYDWL